MIVCPNYSRAHSMRWDLSLHFVRIMVRERLVLREDFELIVSCSSQLTFEFIIQGLISHILSYLAESKGSCIEMQPFPACRICRGR
jgi:hypothetical protein